MTLKARRKIAAQVRQWVADRHVEPLVMRALRLRRLAAKTPAKVHAIQMRLALRRAYSDGRAGRARKQDRAPLLVRAALPGEQTWWPLLNAHERGWQEFRRDCR